MQLEAVGCAELGEEAVGILLTDVTTGIELVVVLAGVQAIDLGHVG